MTKQIYPPSITGKGAEGAAGKAASVLDHSFGKSDPYTLGVEEEYQLLDPRWLVEIEAEAVILHP